MSKDLKEIEIGTYPVAIQFCGSIVHPDTISAAKFSIPYSVAMAISLGDLFMDKFTEENIRDEEIRALASKVRVFAQEEWAKGYPDRRGASVTIRTYSGQAYSSSIPLAKGEPENPATLKDLMEKFRTNAAQVLSPRRSEKLRKNIMNLENLSVCDIARLF
jgi:2-methylcitrate dehydratase PrpD